MTGCEHCDRGWNAPHFTAMDREPCILCNSKRWDAWSDDPYGMKREPPCPKCGSKPFGREKRIAEESERLDKMTWEERIALPRSCHRCDERVESAPVAAVAP